MAGAQPHLGLWGRYNAAKTSFLVALYNMTVDRLMAERYAWWRMYPTNEDGERFVETTARRFLPSGIFPRHTPEGSIYTYNFDIEWRESPLWRRSFSLTAIDAAGADTAFPLIDPMVDPKKGGYFTALRECRVLVCMIETQ